MKRASAFLLVLFLLGGILSPVTGSDAEAAVFSDTADPSEMTEVQDVVDDGMIPVCAEELKDGLYPVEMRSSSSMFRADPVMLEVSGGEMRAILYMSSGSYLCLFPGTAAEAAAAEESAYLPLLPSDDGANCFILPIEALDQGIPCAAFSKRKQKWYDRTLVFCADSLPDEAFAVSRFTDPAELGLSDGEYTVEVRLDGGSGRAKIASPARLYIEGNRCTAEIIWGSANYDYMMVRGERFDPVSREGNSVFRIPVSGFDRPMPVQADTTAMSTPHLIDYTLTFDSESIQPLQKAESLELEAAELFSVDCREDGCYLLTVAGEDSFLLVPEELPAPEAADIPVLRLPLRHIYAASSSVVDLFRAAGCLDALTMTSTAAESWTIPEIREAVEQDVLLYVGKYSAPDYEVLLDEGCELAIENTMIGHCPETKEQLERLGIPVLVERSSYENSPLGRMEWIKLYGLLTGKLAEAEAYFAAASEVFHEAGSWENTGKTVVYFYITSSGYANVRSPDDYLSKMMELAGGNCLFPDLAEESSGNHAAINVQMERFYAAAKDADILIYNGTVDGTLDSLDDLIAKNPLLAEFKAVRENCVWCTERNMFQQTSALAEMVSDLHTVFTGGDGNLRYLRRLTWKELS